MKKLLLITLLISSCVSENYIPMICPKNGDGCAIGGLNFKTLQDCENFVEKASTWQPEVGRFCIKLY